MAILLPEQPTPVSCNRSSFPASTFHSFKLSNSIIVCLLLLLNSLGNVYATDYYQKQSGNWNNPNTWTTNGGWGGTGNTGTYPRAGDNVHFANNGNNATITLTNDAECANLLFEGSEPSCIISFGIFNLIVSNYWTTNWSSNATITQGSGYLQVNGGIPQFYTAKTIANFRVGSNSFYFIQSNQTTLTVSSNYDYNCFESTIPTGINAGSAYKLNISTSCTPTLTATTLAGFGSVCTGSTVGPNSFNISALAITNANVNVGALSGFTYSTTAGGTYTSTLSLAQPGGHFSQIVYVKFNPVTATSYNNNIIISGGGATNINVSAVGSGATSVVPTVTSPTSTNINSSSAILSGNITIEGCSSMSIIERGIYISTTNGFANGSGTKWPETGTFSTGIFNESVSGLSPNTTYYYKAYATNGTGTGYSSQGTFNNTPVTYFTIKSGNWTDPSSWSTTGCGGTVNSGTYPGFGDNVVICSSFNIIVNTTGLSCNNIDMNAYNSQLTLNNDFTINGILTLGSQSSVSVGSNNLTITGDFSFDGKNTSISWTNGNVTFVGNLSFSYNWGTVGLNCTGLGWLIMSGTSKTLTLNNNLNIPNFRQPTSGFSKTGGGNLTITNIFDQNCGPIAPPGVTISIPGNTLFSTCLPTITGSPITGSPFCPGGAVSIPFTITRTYTSGNIFTAQLSGSTGSFASPVNIGTLTSTSAGTISGTIPAGTLSGSGYRIRVISSSPAITGTDNGSNLTVNQITGIINQSTTTQTKCIGGAFIPISINASGAGTLSYQWYSNTSAIPSGGTSLGSSNGAQTNSYTPQTITASTLYYYCVVTGTCSTASSAISGEFIVNPATAITGQSTATQTSCQSESFTPITVTATGVGLTYQWFSNPLAIASGGNNLGSANGAQTNSYTPRSDSAGTLYYYCIVSGTCSSATSAVSGAFITNPVLSASVVIAQSLNPVYEGTMVTFTASPTNGGTNPHYLWKIKGIPVGSDSPVFSYTPVNGDNITCELTSNASPCLTGSPAVSNTVTMIVNVNKWQGNNDNDWNNGGNWLGGYVPSEGYNIEFDTDVKNDLYLDHDRTIGKLINMTNKSLVIPPTLCLTVSDSIISNDVTGDRILIKSSSGAANGSLIFHNKTTKVLGTVEMYSKAFCLSPLTTPKTGYRWQYFGIPVRSLAGSPTFDGSFVRRWDETAQILNTHWVSLSNTSVLTPFTGYEITQDQAKTLIFKGQLLNNDTTLTLSLTNSPALYPGQHIISNPYTSAINIKNLNFVSGLDAVVYLYNAGSYDEWNAHPGTISQGNANAGQFNSIPINVAGYDSGLPGQIPSMQGFMVIASTNNAVFKIPYSAVENNTIAQRIKAVHDTIVQTSTCIEVIGSHASDRMWLFSQPGCSRNYDNGWDGAKLPGNALTPQIFAIEPDGNYQVDALDDINNTQIGFQAGQDTKYTLTFTHQNIKSKYSSLFLLDLAENKTVDITESGSTYTFVAESTPTSLKRFVITCPVFDKEDLEEGSHLKVFNSGNAVMVENLSKQNGEMVVYDVLGRCMKKTTLDPFGVTTVPIGSIAGNYIIKVSVGKEIVSKRIFIGN